MPYLTRQRVAALGHFAIAHARANRTALGTACLVGAVDGAARPASPTGSAGWRWSRRMPDLARHRVAALGRCAIARPWATRAALDTACTVGRVAPGRLAHRITTLETE